MPLVITEWGCSAVKFWCEARRSDGEGAKAAKGAAGAATRATIDRLRDEIEGLVAASTQAREATRLESVAAVYRKELEHLETERRSAEAHLAAKARAGELASAARRHFDGLTLEIRDRRSALATVESSLAQAKAELPGVRRSAVKDVFDRWADENRRRRAELLARVEQAIGPLVGPLEEFGEANVLAVRNFLDRQINRAGDAEPEPEPVAEAEPAQPAAAA
jgi:hypothetical protein